MIKGGNCPICGGPAPEAVEALRRALLAYQRVNRIHNDSEAELYEAGEAALRVDGGEHDESQA